MGITIDDDWWPERRAMAFAALSAEDVVRFNGDGTAQGYNPFGGRAQSAESQPSDPYRREKPREGLFDHTPFKRLQAACRKMKIIP